MNKNSNWYRLLAKATYQAYLALGPLRRFMDGVRRARLFGAIGVHANSDISVDLMVKHPENLRIGRFVRVGPNCQIGAAASVIIEDGVTLSEGVVIETAGLNTRIVGREHVCKPILIKKGAWIGTRAILLGGAVVGENSIVAAGSVVKGDVPDGNIYSRGLLREIRKNAAN